MIKVNPNTPTAPAGTAAAPAPTAEQGILADLDILITEGTVERTVAPFDKGRFKDMRFTMHTLSNPERKLVAREIPNDELMTASAAEHAPKLPTLLYAITCIEMTDKKYTFDTDASRAVLRQLLEPSAAMIDILYLEYLKMLNDLITIIETGVKKN
jgi:hypothetical protein